MGNAKSQQLSASQQDLKFLSERFPFGDAELRHLYRAYQAILTKQHANNNNESSSFLSDWAVQCMILDKRDMAKNEPEQFQALCSERETLIQIMQDQILPKGFGNRLYKTSFLAEGDVSMYEQSCLQSTAADDYTRRRRLEALFEGISNSSRRGAKATLTVLFQYCQTERLSSTFKTRHVDALEFVTVGYRIALAAAFLKATESKDDLMSAAYIPPEKSPEDDAILKSLADSIVQRAKEQRERNGGPAASSWMTTTTTGDASGDDNNLLDEGCFVTLDDLREWCDAHAPVFASALPTLMYRIFFPGRPYPPSRTPFEYPLPTAESCFFTTPSCALLFVFGCLSSSLHGTYFRLYTSDQDGLSFNRLQNALLGYAGPTLMLIRPANNNNNTTTPNSLFGAFTASPWKESKEFYGNSDCFLFQIAPTTGIYRPTGNNARNFMYCNSFARSRGYDQQAHGLGFGGSVTQPRLFLAENFEDCVALAQDVTFENGPLLPSGSISSSKKFDIESLEVWGCGGDDVVEQALGEQQKARELRQEGIRRARKVDKAQFLDDFRSGAIDSKAFAYRQQIDGRADQDVVDRVHEQQEKESNSNLLHT